MRRLLGLVFAALAATLLVVSPAYGAFPGKNGRIAFSADTGPQQVIFSIDPDGSGLTALGPGFSPAWSPDGTKIAFSYLDNSRFSQVFVMNADGSGRRQVTTTQPGGSNPTWSPDEGRSRSTDPEATSS